MTTIRTKTPTSTNPGPKQAPPNPKDQNRITSFGPMGLDPFCNPNKTHSSTGVPVGYNTMHVFDKNRKHRETFTLVPNGDRQFEILRNRYAPKRVATIRDAQTELRTTVNNLPINDGYETITVLRECTNGRRVEGGHF